MRENSVTTLLYNIRFIRLIIRIAPRRRVVLQAGCDDIVRCEGLLVLVAAGAVRHNHGIDAGLVAVGFVEAVGDGVDEVVVEFILDEIDGAASEAASHDA